MGHNINTQMDIVILGSALVLCCVILWRGLVIGREGEEKEFISQKSEEGRREEAGGREEEIDLFKAEENYKLNNSEKVKNHYSNCYF